MNLSTVLFWGLVALAFAYRTLGDWRWWREMKKSEIVGVLENDESYDRLLWEVGKRAFTSGLVATILALAAVVYSLSVKTGSVQVKLADGSEHMLPLHVSKPKLALSMFGNERRSWTVNPSDLPAASGVRMSKM